MPDDPKPATPPTPPAAPASDPTPAAPPAPPTPSPTPSPGEPTPAAPSAPTAPAAPSAPEKYDLKLPEKSTLDGALIDRTAAFAKARGLSQEAAQSALDHAATEVAKTWDDADKQFKAKVEEWKTTTAADLTLGKTPEERTAAVLRGKQVIDRYAAAHPERGAALKSFLNDTGYGEHPAVVGLFAWLGHSVKEGPILTPTPSGGQKTEQQALREMFPNSPELFKEQKAS